MSAGGGSLVASLVVGVAGVRWLNAKGRIDAEFMTEPAKRAISGELYREFRNRYKADKAMHARLNG